MKRTFFVILLLGVGLAAASLRVVIPADCQSICVEPEQAPCPSGTCRMGEQKAGFPLPVIVDSGGGSSPTSGWGKVGPEDLPNLLTFLINSAVYSALLGFVWLGFLAVRRKAKPSMLLRWSPLFGLALVILMLGVSRLRTPPVQRPAAGGPPENAILGNWVADDPVSGREVVFRFYQTGVLSIGDADRGGTLGGGGEYSWVEDDAVRMVIGPERGGSIGSCASMVTFLKDYCHTTVVDPASYPQPAVIPDPAYPVPSPQPVVFSKIDEVLQVEISGDRMTLVHPAGGSLTLQRVTGE